jgi:hypothetical protein
VSTAQPYAVDQPAGRETAEAEEDAEGALAEVDGEMVWSEDEVEENPAAVDELVVMVDKLVVTVDKLVGTVDVILLNVEVLALSAMLDDEECVVDVVLAAAWLLELLVAQLESAVPGHRPTLGMRTAPVLYYRGSASRWCKSIAKHTHGRVRAFARKVRAVELAKQRKASHERSAECIACRACIRARPLLRWGRKSRSHEGKESEGRVHDV